MIPSDSPPYTKAAVLGILRAADVMRRRGTALLAPYDLTLQQYNVLRILRGARPDGLCTLAIVERMLEKTPGITRLIDRLETKKLVVRVRSERDRREVWCRITPAGLRLLAKLDAPVGDLDRSTVAQLSRGEQVALARLLEAVHREPA
jgi:DNA-binding MarR family transcriptional regulator